MIPMAYLTRAFARRLVVLPAAVLAVLGGCAGYQSTNDYKTQPTGGYEWKSLYREDYDSIAVPIFTSTAFDRGVEFRLTRAVVKEVESRTPYKVVPRERAQTVLEGAVTAVTASTISESQSTALPQAQLLTIRVDFTWKDLRTGRILAQRRNYDVVATFYPTLGEGRYVGQQSAIEKLAIAIVQELEADW